MASTARKVSLTRTPACRALSVAVAITGPSIPGSEYGTPTSMMSHWVWLIATIASIEVGTSG